VIFCAFYLEFGAGGWFSLEPTILYVLGIKGVTFFDESTTFDKEQVQLQLDLRADDFIVVFCLRVELFGSSHDCQIQLFE